MEYYSSLDSRALDAETPTLFEILSLYQLEQLLSPSIRYVVVHYAQRHPRLLLRVALWFDELNLVVRGAIEYSQLRSWNASFTEKFYGLKRVDEPRGGLVPKKAVLAVPLMVEERRRLRPRQVWGSLFLLLGVPYLQEKLEVWYERLLPQHLMNNLHNKGLWQDRLKYWFMKVYPAATAILRTLNVVFQVLYLSGRVRAPLLGLHLLRVKYARLNLYDYDLERRRTEEYLGEAAPAKLLSRMRPPSSGETLLAQMASVVTPTRRTALAVAGTAFPAAIFSLKFLEWWNQLEFAAKFAKLGEEGVEGLPPPRQGSAAAVEKTVESDADSEDESEDESNPRSGACPLCNKPMHNPAAIETGHVFCYTCIYTALAEGKTNGKCPVTGIRLLGCVLNEASGEWRVEGVRRLML